MRKLIILGLLAKLTALATLLAIPAGANPPGVKRTDRVRPLRPGARRHAHLHGEPGRQPRAPGAACAVRVPPLVGRREPHRYLRLLRWETPPRTRRS